MFRASCKAIFPGKGQHFSFFYRLKSAPGLAGALGSGWGATRGQVSFEIGLRRAPPQLCLMGMPFSKSVNDFVARAAGTVNAVVAVAIMGIGVLVGLVGLLTTVTAPRSERFLMVVVIPLGAVLLTVLLCGFLAVLQNIRDLLAELLEETRARTKRGAS